MEQVSAMFGKRLGEEFTVKYQTAKYKYVTQYHVTFEEERRTLVTSVMSKPQPTDFA